MLPGYHTPLPGVNSTPVHVPQPAPNGPDPAMWLGPRLLRMFYHIQGLCANPQRCCYAGIKYLADERGREGSTVRRQINEIVAQGMIRKVRTAGGRNLLFICPPSAWNPLPECAENAHTLSIGNPLKALPDKTTKPARESSTPSAPSLTLGPPVVVDSAKASETGTETDCDRLRPIETQESAEDVAAILAASIGNAEEMMQALGDVETVKESQTLSHSGIKPSGPESGDPAAGRREASPKPNPQDSTDHLTPEQEVILRQLIRSEVAPMQAGLMVRGDASKAEAVLRAFRTARGVRDPGAWILSCWRDPEWQAPTERRQDASPSPYARHRGLRISDGPPAPLLPTGRVPLPPDAVSALRAARRSVRGRWDD